MSHTLKNSAKKSFVLHTKIACIDGEDEIQINYLMNIFDTYNYNDNQFAYV